MDIVDYAAFGGLERVAIIIGGLIIGYWGYLLYSKGKSAGLAFLGIACVLLVATLFIGGQRALEVSDPLPLAADTTAAPEIGVEPSTADTLVEADALASAPDLTLTDSAISASDEETVWKTGEIEAPATTEADSPATTEADSPATTVADRSDDTTQLADASAAIAADDANATIREALISAQELGGRIVSVKSPNVSLEWTAATAGPADTQPVDEETSENEDLSP